MSLPVTLNRRSFTEGDLLQASDFNEGFVQDAIVETEWAGAAPLDFKSTTIGDPTIVRLRNRGTGANASARLAFLNEDAAGATLSSAVLANNAAGCSQFGAGLTGGIQFGTSDDRSLEFILKSQPLLTLSDSGGVKITSGKDLQLGRTTVALQAPNFSIPVKDSTGTTVYLACYR